MSDRDDETKKVRSWEPAEQINDDSRWVPGPDRFERLRLEWMTKCPRTMPSNESLAGFVRLAREAGYLPNLGILFSVSEKPPSTYLLREGELATMRYCCESMHGVGDVQWLMPGTFTVTREAFIAESRLRRILDQITTSERHPVIYHFRNLHAETEVSMAYARHHPYHPPALDRVLEESIRANLRLDERFGDRFLFNAIVRVPGRDYRVMAYEDVRGGKRLLGDDTVSSAIDAQVAVAALAREVEERGDGGR